MEKETDIVVQTDGRKKGEYETRYTNENCKKKIIRDAIYLAILFLLALSGIFLNFLGVFENLLNLTGNKAILFHKVSYCVCSSLLGGVTFGIKYFYRVVARGLWNEDRIYWRLFSPWVAVSLSIVIAAIMIKDVSSSSSLSITIGFLTGYFSDEAVGKLYEVACVLFLKPTVTEKNKRDKVDDQIDREQEEEKEYGSVGD